MTLEQLLALNRRTLTPPLEFALIPSIILDSQHLEQVFNHLQWHKYPATPNLYQSLPTSPGLYAFVWNTGISATVDPIGEVEFRYVLYVGKTGDDGPQTLRLRYQQEYSNYINAEPENLWHKQSSLSRAQRLKGLFSLRTLEYWCCEIQDASRLKMLESIVIDIFQPPGNHQRNVAFREGKALTATKISSPTKAF